MKNQKLEPETSPYAVISWLVQERAATLRAAPATSVTLFDSTVPRGNKEHSTTIVQQCQQYIASLCKSQDLLGFNFESNAAQTQQQYSATDCCEILCVGVDPTPTVQVANEHDPEHGPQTCYLGVFALSTPLYIASELREFTIHSTQLSTTLEDGSKITLMEVRHAFKLFLNGNLGMMSLLLPSEQSMWRNNRNNWEIKYASLHWTQLTTAVFDVLEQEKPSLKCGTLLGNTGSPLSNLSTLKATLGRARKCTETAKKGSTISWKDLRRKGSSKEPDPTQQLGLHGQFLLVREAAWLLDIVGWCVGHGSGDNSGQQYPSVNDDWEVQLDAQEVEKRCGELVVSREELEKTVKALPAPQVPPLTVLEDWLVALRGWCV
eukprot:TRINITY_DN32919_c0_g1_i1.p1 TRINITY_DN32919_c0_g1~~TRINITY_DN32919_c0_g1_i1.p1  ORF type:complete len:411 (-),score=34.48 TRINITY_DN32919_c0_g1_i1:38-1168(-)